MVFNWLVEGCIGATAAKTQPSFNMCPVVAVHWLRTGRKTWFTQS